MQTVTLYAKKDGACIRVGNFGEATRTRGVVVPVKVARELLKPTVVGKKEVPSIFTETPGVEPPAPPREPEPEQQQDTTDTDGGDGDVSTDANTEQPGATGTTEE